LLKKDKTPGQHRRRGLRNRHILARLYIYRDRSRYPTFPWGSNEQRSGSTVLCGLGNMAYQGGCKDGRPIRELYMRRELGTLKLHAAKSAHPRKTAVLLNESRLHLQCLSQTSPRLHLRCVAHTDGICQRHPPLGCVSCCPRCY
jgi:hypothetical protein